MIKKGDFIELEYTGKTKDTSMVFDTSSAEAAKKHEIYNERMSYGPVIICIGQSQLVKGLDEHLPGKEEGREYSIDLKPEDAFGKKSPKLLKIVNTSVFLKQNIQPVPGLQLNIDGAIGTVRTVTGGRTVVDFNHPLAGKEITYDVKINRVVKENAEKIKGFIELELRRKADVAVNDGVAEIRIKDALPKAVKDELEKKLLEIIKLKEVKFMDSPRNALENGSAIEARDATADAGTGQQPKNKI